MKKLTPEHMHEMTIAEFKRLPKSDRDRYFKSEIYQQIIAKAENESIRSRQSQKRIELTGDHDDSLERYLLEMRQITGLSINELQDGFTVEGLDRWRQAEIRKRSRESDHWIEFNPDESFKHRSTISRDAQNPDLPHIEKARRGVYRVRASRKGDYLKRP
jgi:hypothetical protein